MAAIITDQIRILNARNFLSGVTTSGSSYYSFIGLPNATDIQSDWDNAPPAPIDNFDYQNEVWETVIGLKKITASDARLVVPKITWRSGNTYDLYRHDYTTSNSAKVSGATNLYGSFFYVMNSDYRVYICLQNGTSPDNPMVLLLLTNQHLLTSNQEQQVQVEMVIFGSICLLSVLLTL